MIDIKDYGVFDLTPVEEIRKGLFLKRDDLFMPFKDIPLSGGKVRQAMFLVSNNYDKIVNECGGKIVTGTSVNSPQGTIVARVAKEFGLSSVIFVGNTTLKSLTKNNLMMNALRCGAKINIESRLAYDNVLSATIKRYMDAGNDCFQVKFGINLEDSPEAILDSVAYQVQNLPNDLDILVVPCGSGITFGGILRGLEKYNKKPKRVIGIQISGYDRVKTVEKIMGEDYKEYEFLISKDYPYSKHVNLHAGNVDLDPIYEAKAYDYMLKNIDIENKKVCFWVVGNSRMIRELK